MQGDSKIVFMLQEVDICYLVENICGGQSALSARKDLSELTTVRWDKNQPWSPWNCVVLTIDEVEDHFKLEDPIQVNNKIYAHNFME